MPRVVDRASPPCRARLGCRSRVRATRRRQHASATSSRPPASRRARSTSTSTPRTPPSWRWSNRWPTRSFVSTPVRVASRIVGPSQAARPGRRPVPELGARPRPRARRPDAPPRESRPARRLAQDLTRRLVPLLEEVVRTGRRRRSLPASTTPEPPPGYVLAGLQSRWSSPGTALSEMPSHWPKPTGFALRALGYQGPGRERRECVATHALTKR